MPSFWRLVTGFLVCPTVPLALYLTVELVRSGWSAVDGLGEPLLIAWLGAIVPITWLVGIPLFIILHKFGRHNYRNYVISGACAAFVVGLPLGILAFFALPIGAAIGAMLYWSLWGRWPPKLENFWGYKDPQA